MEEVIQKNDLLQWHPAFYAGLQIELEADSENLVFEIQERLWRSCRGVVECEAFFH